MDKSKKRKWRTRKIKKKRYQNRTKNRRYKKTKQMKGGKVDFSGLTPEQKKLVCSLYPYIAEDINGPTTRTMYLSDDPTIYDNNDTTKYNYTLKSILKNTGLLAGKNNITFTLTNGGTIYRSGPGKITPTYKIDSTDDKAGKFLFVFKMIDIDLEVAFRYNVNLDQSIGKAGQDVKKSLGNVANKSVDTVINTSKKGAKFIGDSIRKTEEEIIEYPQEKSQSGGWEKFSDIYNETTKMDIKKGVKLNLPDLCIEHITSYTKSTDYINFLRFLVNYKASSQPNEIIETLIKTGTIADFPTKPHLCFFASDNNDEFYYFWYDENTLNLNGYKEDNYGIIKDFVDKLKISHGFVESNVADGIYKSIKAPKKSMLSFLSKTETNAKLKEETQTTSKPEEPSIQPIFNPELEQIKQFLKLLQSKLSS